LLRPSHFPTRRSSDLKDFFRDLAKAMKDVTLDEQKLYLEYNLISAAAPYLSDDFVNANFDFFGRTMSGREELQPRWKRALGTTRSEEHTSELQSRFHL